MDYISLVVKQPDVLEAVRAAARRGINVLDERTSTSTGYTVLTAPVSDLDKIVGWFTEPNELVKGRGYPDGTLLIYSFHEGVN